MSGITMMSNISFILAAILSPYLGPISTFAMFVVIISWQTCLVSISQNVGNRSVFIAV